MPQVRQAEGGRGQGEILRPMRQRVLGRAASSQSRDTQLGEEAPSETSAQDDLQHMQRTAHMATAEAMPHLSRGLRQEVAQSTPRA
jgi:hypothetical protein